MREQRKIHTATFKAQVALAAVKNDRTANEVASQFDVHPILVHGDRRDR
jgi:transposase-like protein